jgi:aspartyl-tRNA(Asn)/glutamyl-tRNA(Gln) amidotransferase subunit B
MRSKENAIDYRYFPEPDLLQLEITNNLLDEAEKKLKESTFKKITRYKEQFGFNKEFINGLI